MDIVLAAAVCLGILAVGELISYFTKAFVPSMAAALLLYLILTWCGMPTVFPETSGFSYIGEFAMLIFIVHLATTVPPGDYLKEIKSVIIAAAALAGGLLMQVGVGGLIFGFDKMIVGAGAVCGAGAVGGILSIQKATELGLTGLIGIPTILLCTVDLYGQPIASIMLKKFAGKLRAQDAYLLEQVANKDNGQEPRLTRDGVPYGSEDNPSRTIRCWIPKRLEEDGFVLFELVIVAFIAYWLSNVTGVSNVIFAFGLGLIACAVGIFRMNLLDRCHSSGFVVCVFIIWLMQGINSCTPSVFMSALLPVAAALILATIGLSLGGGICGKLLGFDFWLSAAAGLGLMFLMPGVAIVTTEVAKRSARNPEEEKYMRDKSIPCMYIVANAGYIMGVAVTVTFLIGLLG